VRCFARVELEIDRLSVLCLGLFLKAHGFKGENPNFFKYNWDIFVRGVQSVITVSYLL
jgi:hypothetical protein